MSVDPVAAAVLSLVTAERLAELALARRNTARLLAQGGLEHGAAHYPLIVALHAAWLAGLWWLAIGTPPALGLLALFAIVEAARAWVLVTLGRRWTTRIIVVPGEQRVRKGPYRFLAHPNYAVVVAEILLLPLAFGLVSYAIAFSVLNGVLLAVRIPAETAAFDAAVRRPEHPA